MLRNPDPFRIYRRAGSFKSRESAECIIANEAQPPSDRPLPLDCGVVLSELAPAPFALYVSRSGGAGDRGDAPADCRDESRSRTGRWRGQRSRPILSDTFPDCGLSISPAMNIGESQRFQSGKIP